MPLQLSKLVCDTNSMRKHFYCVAILLLASACSSISYHSPGPYYGGAILGSGTYTGDIYLEPSQGEPYRLQSLFHWQKGDVFLSGVSSSGETIFRVSDKLHRSENPPLQLKAKAWAAKMPELEEFYKGLRLLFLLQDKQQDKPSQHDPLVKEAYSDGRPRLLSEGAGTELTITEYDWEGRAHKLFLATGTLKAKIVLREYTRE